MPNYTWYNVFNEDEFIAEDLISKTVSLNLEDLGTKEMLLTRGNLTCLTYDAGGDIGKVVLPLDFESQNPYDRDGVALYKDSAGEVWLGFEIEEEEEE